MEHDEENALGAESESDRLDEPQPEKQLRKSGFFLFAFPPLFVPFFLIPLLDGLESFLRGLPIIIMLTVSTVFFVRLGLAFLLAASAAGRQDFELARDRMERAASVLRLVSWFGFASALVAGLVFVVLNGGWLGPVTTGIALIPLSMYGPMASRTSANVNKLLGFDGKE